MPQVLVRLAVAVTAEQKREAEPHYDYGGYYSIPFRANGNGYDITGGQVHVHAIAKREAEAGAEPHNGYYRTYGYPYGQLYALHAHS